jgi:hypothetical protein
MCPKIVFNQNLAMFQQSCQENSIVSDRRVVQKLQTSRSKVRLGANFDADGTLIMTSSNCATIKRLVSIMNSGEFRITITFFRFPKKKVKTEVGRRRKKAIDAKTRQTRRLRRKGHNASIKYFANVFREALCMDLLLAFLSRHGPGWRGLVATQVLQDRSRSRRDCWKP